jgi:hypothetical protein
VDADKKYPISSLSELRKAEELVKSYESEKRKMSTNNSSNVSVGLSTKAGFGTALVAFAGAIVDHFTSGGSGTAIELAGLGLISGGITQVGRYLQAHGQIEASSAVTVASEYATITGINDIKDDIKNIVDRAIKDAKGITSEVTSDVEKVVSDPSAIISDVENAVENYPNVDDLPVAPQPAPGVVPADNSTLAPANPTPVSTTGA